MASLNWAKDVHPTIVEALRYFSSQGVRPTLRTIFYNLVSKNIIGNTKAAYKGLSKWLVKARKDGLVAWDAIEDTARNVYGNFADERFNDNIVEQDKNTLTQRLDEFNAENILNDFFDIYASRAYVSRWADQPTIAEIWIEKEALAKTVQSWTEYMGVKIRVNKGYSSWTFIYENARELAEYLRGSHDKIVVFYLGDLDPSGVDMERFLNEALDFFDLNRSKVELRRLSVTVDQVKKYKLPPRPEDAETLAKLKRDPRTRSYGLPYVVELDAMVAFVPQQFHGLIVDAIKSCWNKDVYDNLRAKADTLNVEIEKVLADIKEQAKEKFKEI